jgi:hypothetical protein
MNQGRLESNWHQWMGLHCTTDPDGWLRTPTLTKTRAEQLLDWLENHGLRDFELLVDAEQGFVVRWRP